MKRRMTNDAKARQASSQKSMALKSVSSFWIASLFTIHLLACSTDAFVGCRVPSSIHRTVPSRRGVRIEGNSASTVSSVATILDNDSKENIRDTSTHIVFPGGGIFFYWQAGVVSYLRERGYDLSRCTFSGASAGALTATLTAADVDFYEATDLALTLAAEAKVWDRGSGLQGIWGTMIEEWLQELLPDSIENFTSNQRLSLLVTPIPTFGKARVSDFSNKEDLIQCNMASIHLPWFLNGKLTSNYRDNPHIDGSFMATLSDYYPSHFDEGKRETLVLDWKYDPAMNSKGGLDFVEAVSPDGIWRLVDKGKSYAQVLERTEMLKRLER